MDIRFAMNNHKGATFGVVIAIIAGITFYFLHYSGPRQGMPSQSFFTTDDGKTFFTDASSKIPPFDHDGVPAYGCYVFSDDGGKTKYVGWLYRYTSDGKMRLAGSQNASGQLGSSMFNCIEVKAPGTGDNGWLPCTDPKAARIQRPVKRGENDPVRVEPD